MDWTVRFYEDDGWEPAKEFLVEELTNAERSRFVQRMKYLQKKGLQLVAERPDILRKVEGESNLFRLSMTKSQNNPRFLLCAQTGQTLTVLHGFKEQSTSDYEAAIEVAVRRRDKLQNPQRYERPRA